jgi:peptidylamidoglycolate lyase
VQAGWPALPPGVELGQASGVAVDARDRVYVFHRAGRGFHNDRLIDAPTVFVFDGPTGRLLDRWGAGKFVVPHGIAVDADGNLWLTDVGLDRVFKFSPEGRELLSIGRER